MLESVILVSDGKERTHSETFGSSVRISLHHLSHLRSGRVVIWLPPQSGSVPDVWLRAEPWRPGSAAADNLPARRPRKPRLRVPPPRDAPSPRRRFLVFGLRFGGPTREIRMPHGSATRKGPARAEVIAKVWAEIPAHRQHRRCPARGARSARRKEVSHRKFLPAINRACGYVANARDEGGLKDVYRTH